MEIRKLLVKAMAAALAAIVILGITPTNVLAQENRVTVNEQIVQFDQPVRIEQGRILAPIKPIADAIGAEIRWNAETSTTTVILGNAGVAIATDNPTMVVRNMTSGATENVTLPVMAKSYNGIVFVPLENVATALGLKVQRDSANSITQITTPGFTPPKPVEVPRYYLESEIKAVSEAPKEPEGNRGLVFVYKTGPNYDDIMMKYPKNGSFKIGDKTYFRGISNTNSDSYVRGKDNTVTYDIAGRGFTILTGIFGGVLDEEQVSNSLKIVYGSGSRPKPKIVGGTMTISGDGRFLGGFEVNAGGTPVSIDVNIPPQTKEIIIRLGYGLGLGDAFFSSR